MIKNKATRQTVAKVDRRFLHKADSSGFYVCTRSDQADMPAKIRAIGRQLAKDPVAAKAMLHRTGMYDENGRLKEEFR